MLIRKSEVKKLSDDVRRIIDGQDIDLRDHREGVWGILKNDIHTLASLKNEQVDALQHERDSLADTLANISHQLKTPLTSLMIMTDLLESALATEQPSAEKQAEFLTNIMTGLTRMEWLVSSLLKMAKLDAGAVIFSPDSMPADALAQLALEPLQILLDVKNQTVELACDTVLRCDRRWTSEALTNVIKNASEYSPEGGVLRIASGTNPICTWISVTDSGAGIRSAQLPQLFQRFVGSRSDAGYGIGLPLALAILRAQNGDIEVEGGGNGVGATFTLKLYR